MHLAIRRRVKMALGQATFSMERASRRRARLAEALSQNGTPAVRVHLCQLVGSANLLIVLAVQAVSSEPVSRGHIPCSLGKNREFQRKQGFWSDGRCEKTRQPSVLEVEFPMPSNREFFPTEQGISAKDQGPNSYCDEYANFSVDPCSTAGS